MAALYKLATRQSKLALIQTGLAQAFLEKAAPGARFEQLPCTTTGDQQQQWSLEERGGSGLFIKELEKALLEGKADIAVHSAKDLPTTNPEGLVIAGYLPRANPADILVIKADCDTPRTLATGSPRRRALLKKRWPEAEFTALRGTVPTRLKKIADNPEVDGTVLAAAGLERLGISEYPGLRFEALPIDAMIPAAGQGAIALQCRAADAENWAHLLDANTHRAVTIERAFLHALGCGCHTACGCFFDGKMLHLFHESFGFHTFGIQAQSEAEINAEVSEIVKHLDYEHTA